MTNQEINAIKVQVAEALVAKTASRSRFVQSVRADLESAFSSRGDQETAVAAESASFARRYTALMERCAAIPEMRARMRCWMVEFHGRWKSDSVEAKPLQQDVTEWLAMQDYRITDYGAGADTWDIGVLCTDQESTRLCEGARRELGGFIEAGLLTVSLKFWGWRFVGLENAAAAQAFLEKQSSS